MSGSYCCFRLEMNKKRKYQNELIHNLRRGKKINHQINNNRNFVNFKGVNYSFNKNNDKETADKNNGGIVVNLVNVTD